jgi:hypothetical protein
LALKLEPLALKQALLALRLEQQQAEPEALPEQKLERQLEQALALLQRLLMKVWDCQRAQWTTVMERTPLTA